MAKSSLKDEAFILREWLPYLSTRDLAWDQADDFTIAAFRNTFEENKLSVQISHARIERKIQVIFDFYRFIHLAIPITEAGCSRRPMVDEGASITSKRMELRSGKFKTVWQGATSANISHQRRYTPNETEVVKILTFLRAKHLRDQSRRNTRDASLLRQLGV